MSRLAVTRERTEAGVGVLRVRIDRETLLAADTSEDWEAEAGVWRYGPGTDRADTRRRLTEGRPTDALAAAYASARESIDAALADVQTLATTTRRRRVRSTDGDEIDVSRYVEAPERDDCWRTLARDTRPHRIVRLGIDFAAGTTARAETIARSGALAAAAADALRARGIGVEIALLDVTDTTGMHGPWQRERESGMAWYALDIPWAAASDPLDEGSLAVLGLPGLLRNHGFGVIQAAGVALGSTRAAADDDCGNYGTPRPLPPGMLALLGVDAYIGLRTTADGIVQTLRGIILGERGAEEVTQSW